MVSEEYEAAKEIFTRALRKYRLPESEIGRIVRRIQDWGYAKSIRSDENSRTVPEPDPAILSLRIRMFTVEPGSPADGKSVAELELKNRFGITGYGIRRAGATDIDPDPAAKLRAGDALIVFTSDTTANEMAGLFSPVQ